MASRLKVRRSSKPQKGPVMKILSPFIKVFDLIFGIILFIADLFGEYGVPVVLFTFSGLSAWGVQSAFGLSIDWALYLGIAFLFLFALISTRYDYIV